MASVYTVNPNPGDTIIIALNGPLPVDPAEHFRELEQTIVKRCGHEDFSIFVIEDPT